MFELNPNAFQRHQPEESNGEGAAQLPQNTPQEINNQPVAQSMPFIIKVETSSNESTKPKLADFDESWHPVIWFEYATRMLEEAEEKVKVNVILSAMKGERAKFITKFEGEKTLRNLKAHFFRHFVCDDTELDPPLWLWYTVSKLTKLSEENVEMLKILAKETGLEEQAAVTRTVKALPEALKRKLSYLPSTWEQFKFASSLISNSTDSSITEPGSKVVNLADRTAQRCYRCNRIGHQVKDCQAPIRYPNGRGSSMPRHKYYRRHEPQAKRRRFKANLVTDYEETSDEETSDGLKRAKGDSKVYTASKSSINQPRYEYSSVEASIYGKPVRAIADSGANSVIISLATAKRLRIEVSREPYYITIADGSTIKTRGIAKEVPIKLGDSEKKFDCLVLDTKSYSVLLGTEALHAFGAVLDFEKGKLFIKGKAYPMQSKLPGREPIGIVRMACEVRLKPHQEVFVPIKYNKSRETKAEKWSFEPSPRLASDKAVFAAHGMYSEETEKYVLMINTSEETQTIPKGIEVGQLQDWEEIEQTDPREIEFEMPDLSHIKNSKHRLALEQLLKRYKQLFTKVKPGKSVFGVKHSIALIDKTPIRESVRRIAHNEEEFLREHLKELEEEGFIETSVSPYAAPIIIVPKKSGGFRLCIDYRRLNEKTIKEQYPIPRIDETFDSIAGSVIFSTLDLQSGYWQVSMDEKDRKLTAFITKFGLFQWKVMPFGLTNAPATFQRLMDAVLRGLKWECCLVYLDDIIIYSQGFEEHLAHLEKVFNRLAIANLKVNSKKCKFATSELIYLGHVVSRDGIRPDPAKVEAVLKMKTPKDISEVRTLIGLFSYYRKFIKDFSHIAEPLIRLTRKNIPFVWGEGQERAFKILIEKLVSEPILAYPDFKKPFILQTDASSFAVGAVLAQVQKGKERVIAYASQMLNKSQQNYSVTVKEAFAIHWATSYFRPYLLGREFVIQTDHKALECLTTKTPNNSKLARWAIALQDFRMRLQYRKGSQNSNADAMSRMVGMFARTSTFKFSNGVLKFADRIVPSREERDEILEKYHKTMGHPSKQALYEEISKVYYWSTLKADIETLQASCITCAKHQEIKTSRASVPIDVVSPFERLGIDLVGPLPVTRVKNRFVIVCTDYFTHFAITEAIPEKTAERVAKFLDRRVFNVFGPCKILQSDQGLEFKNTLVQELCKRHRVNQTFSSPYHPQTNGLVEKTNHTLVRKIASISEDQKLSWDDALPIATFAYNVTPQKLLESSPYTLMFGRLPSITDDVDTQILDIRELHEKNRRRINSYKQKIRESEKRKVSPNSLQIGDIVMMRNREASKLEPKWKGPFHIVEKGLNGAYVIQDLDRPEKWQVNYDDIKHYTGRDDGIFALFVVSE